VQCSVVLRFCALWAASVVCRSHAYALSVDAQELAHASGVTTHTEQPAPNAVFFAPQTLSPELRSALEDALSAQLSLLRATVHYETARAAPSGPVERLRLAKDTAREHSAVVVFWLEPKPDGPWLLYAVDAQAHHLITRVIVTRDHGAQADIEALALIVRATTAAFLDSASDSQMPETSETPVFAEPLVFDEPERAESADLVFDTDIQSAAPRKARIPKRGARDAAGLRMSLGLLGADFAPQTSPLHALELRAAWWFPRGPYVGVGYTAGRALRFDVADARFELERHPMSVHAGLRTTAGPLTLAAELGAELELRHPKTLTLRSDYTLAPDRNQLVYNLVPRLEAALALTRRIATYVAASTDIAVGGNIPYMLIDTATAQSRYMVEPSAIRLTLHVGIGIML